LRRLFSDGVVSLYPVVVELIESDHTALVLLRHVVGYRSTTYSVRTNHYDVKLVFILESGRQLDFQGVLEQFNKPGLHLALLVS
jgi:hypothetical protein